MENDLISLFIYILLIFICWMANNNLAVVQQSTSKAFNPHPVGTMLMDRFKVLKTLGKGSFGVVYQVRDEKTKDTFALK